MITKDSISKILASEINKTAKKGTEVTEDQLKQFLSSYDRSDRIVHTSYIRGIMDNEPKAVPVSTGIEDLDELIGGFYEGQVIVLTARPKSGKTEMALQLVSNLCPEPVLFLPLEQGAKELMEQRDEENYDTPEFYTPLDTTSAHRDTDWVHLKILETSFLVNKKLRVVLLDHFGYITAEKGVGEAYTYSVIETMQSLKRIAREAKISLVVVVHTNRGDETVPPGTEDIFGSSGFHQEADIVLSMWREAYREEGIIKKTRNVLLQVLANRRKGKIGAIKFIFDEGKFIQGDWKGHDQELKENKKLVDEQFKNHGK